MAQTLASTLGVTLLGILFSCMLFGVTTLQTFIYIKRFWNSDLTWLKLFVALIWILEAAHTAFLCSYIFRVVTTDIFDPALLTRTTVSDDITTAMTAFIIFFVQCFYTWRLWLLSHRKLVLVVPLAILIVIHLGLEMAVMALTFKWPDFSQFRRITGYFTGAVAVAAATDITIAAAMFTLLQNRKTGIKNTEQLLNRIVMYTISTGLLTSMVDIVILGAASSFMKILIPQSDISQFVGLPDTLVYLCFFDFVPNLYANSLLAMLNSRMSTEERNLHLEVELGGGSGNTIQFSNFRSRNATRHTEESTFTQVDSRKTAQWVIDQGSNAEISTQD